jgi:hypothetical protein
VCMLPNSATRPRPGSVHSSPGVRSTNSAVATITGPQSAMPDERTPPLKSAPPFWCAGTSLCLLRSQPSFAFSTGLPEKEASRTRSLACGPGGAGRRRTGPHESHAQGYSARSAGKECSRFECRRGQAQKRKE